MPIEKIHADLDAAAELVFESYYQYLVPALKNRGEEEPPKEYNAAHAAAKVALQHLELLLKLIKMTTPINGVTDANDHLQAELAAAQAELDMI